MRNRRPAALTAGAPLRFSASRIERYITCPLQAKFRYLDKLPDPMNSAAAFGRCIHHCLEHYNKGEDIEDAVVRFLHVWEHPELLDSAIEVWTYGATYGGYRKRGEQMLRDYHDAMLYQRRTVLATEHEFLVPFGDYELYGFVDLVELRRNRSKNEIHLVDYKTAKRLPKMSALPWNVQFSVYSYAAAQPEFWLGNKTADKVTKPINTAAIAWAEARYLEVRPIYYHLENSRAIETGIRGDEDYMRLHRVCTEIEKAIKYDVYVPNLSGESCGYCAYKDPCGLPIPKEGDAW